MLGLLLSINFVRHTRKRNFTFRGKKCVLQVVFPQTDIHNYGIREFTLKCMVRKWGLMCVGKVREGCGSFTNFYLQMCAIRKKPMIRIVCNIFLSRKKNS